MAKETTDEFLAKVKDRWKLAVTANTDQYERSKRDLEFCDPENQWPNDIKNLRQDKPCLVVDVLTPIIKQIVNEQRQNRPAIRVSPVDDQSDKETAEILQGIVRHIEYNSDADVAYDRACEAQVRGGIGYIRVTTEYSDPMSFDQEIKILSVPNPFMVYLDPSSMDPDGHDAQWGFIAEDMSRSDYEAAYPDSDLSQKSTSEWQGIADQAPDWMSGEKAQACRVMEYFEKAHEPATLYKLETGEVVTEVPEGGKVIDSRKTTLPKVRWYKLNAVEILDQTVWECEFIPLIPVYGDELIIDGQKNYFGIIHRAKDVQKMINVWKSVQTETIGLSSKAPWLTSVESIKGYEDVWRTANTRDWNTLPWNAFDEQQRQLPPPSRNIQEPPIQAITMALQGSMADIKAVTGMYDPNLGARDSASQSGVAIRNLQHQGQVGNFHFQDNMSRSIKHLGRILVQLIRKYYDSTRIVRTIGVDDSQKLVLVNGALGEPLPEGQERHYDLKTGRYDVTISVGPSYTSKRQENLTTLLDLQSKLPPNQVGLISDLIASQIDAPIAEEIARRLKATLPPELQDKKPGQPQIPPQLQQQLQAMAQQHEALTARVHELTDALTDQDKRAEQEMRRAELDSNTKLEIARISQETDLLKIKAQIAAQSGGDVVSARIAEIQDQQEQLAAIILQLGANPAPAMVPSPNQSPVTVQTAGQGAQSLPPQPSVGLEAGTEAMNG